MQKVMGSAKRKPNRITGIPNRNRRGIRTGLTGIARCRTCSITVFFNSSQIYQAKICIGTAFLRGHTNLRGRRMVVEFHPEGREQLLGPAAVGAQVQVGGAALWIVAVVALITYSMRAVAAGSFEIAPPCAEAMYEPEICGSTAADHVRVE
mgnify:CR=1 FL=1